MNGLLKNLQQKAIIIISVVMIFYACSSIVSTPIRKILEDPRAYSGKTVTVSGEVTEIFSIFFIKYFVLTDSTGEIAVITQRPLPQKGAKIRVKGIVEEAFSMGDKQLIVIVEKTERK